MFPEKFTFKNNEVRTNKIEKAFLLLCNENNGRDRIKKRDVSLNEKTSRVVPGAGLEPAR